MSHFLRIVLSIVIVSLTVSCAAKIDSSDIKSEPLLLTGSWQVEDIDKRGMLDYAMVTLQFTDVNRISGSTGCNQFTGTVETANGAFVASQVASTRRACAPAVGEQEQRFLAALNDAVRYEFKEKTWLVIYDAADKPRLKLIQTEPRPKPRATKMDQALKHEIHFQCETVSDVSMRFIGPETIAFSVAGRVAVLQRVRTASGAKYSGENIEFWNKGNEARLAMNGYTYNCKPKVP